MPKGVVWRQEDAFYACIGGGDPMRLQGPVERARGARRAHRCDDPFCFLPVAPLMHGAAQWTSLVVALRRGQGRAHARLARPRRGVAHRSPPRASTSSRSSATPWPGRCSTSGTRGAAATTPRRCSRSAPAGRRCRRRGQGRLLADVPQRHAWPTASARRRPAPRARTGQRRRRGPARPFDARRKTTVVLDPEASSRSSPARASVGRVARRRPHPARLPQRPREDGGDLRRARRRALGAHRRHGHRRRRRHRSRCSAGARCASTPAARRSSPRRSRACSWPTPASTTCWSSGVADDRWGERVAAVVQPAPGAAAHARRPRRPTAGSTWPATRCPSASSSSTHRPLARRQARLPLGQGRRHRRHHPAHLTPARAALLLLVPRRLDADVVITPTIARRSHPTSWRTNEPGDLRLSSCISRRSA